MGSHFDGARPVAGGEGEPDYEFAHAPCMFCGCNAFEPCDCIETKKKDRRYTCKCGEGFNLHPGESQTCWACGARAVCDAQGTTITHADWFGGSH